MTEGVELLNRVVIRTLGEKETYKYLGILEADTIKQVEMKEKKIKTVSQKNQRATREETPLHELCQKINTWGVHCVRDFGPLLK